MIEINKLIIPKYQIHRSSKKIETLTIATDMCFPRTLDFSEFDLKVKASSLSLQGEVRNRGKEEKFRMDPDLHFLYPDLLQAHDCCGLIGNSVLGLMAF